MALLLSLGCLTEIMKRIEEVGGGRTDFPNQNWGFAADSN